MSEPIDQQSLAGPGSDLPATAFVSMSPNPELQSVYLRVIKPTLETHGFICSRNESAGGSAIITPQVFEYIDAADLVLCDLTYNYGPTYYDLGIAHAFRKPTILISQQAGEIPFDTRYQRVLAYKEDRFSLLDLRDSLSVLLRTIYPEGTTVSRNLTPPVEILPVTLSELDQARVALYHHSIDAQRYAIRFLGDNRDEKSYDKIRSLVANRSADAELVRDGLVALCRIDPARAFEDDLWGMYGINHSSHLVREQVVGLIGTYPKTDTLVRRLMDQINDSSWGVRVAVCQVLGKWHATQAQTILAQRVVDPEPAVRAAAEEALRRITEKGEGAPERSSP
jgi:nucleoside 2-deoxyribosyltransferase